eukprot:sb/3469003/
MLDEETMQGDIQAEYLSILSTEMKITECLVRQILPRELAQQIRDGTPFVNTCQEFSEVTVVFSDMVGFNELCSSLTPMQVETVGDAYLLVGGLPTKDDNHAKYAANIAIEMVQKIQQVKVDFLKSSISVKLGIHTGPVVAVACDVDLTQVSMSPISLSLRCGTTSVPSKFHPTTGRVEGTEVLHVCLSYTVLSYPVLYCLSLNPLTPGVVGLKVWWGGRYPGTVCSVTQSTLPAEWRHQVRL